MRRNPPRRSWAAVLVLLGLAAEFVPAARADQFQLEPVALPAPLLERGKVNVAIEASGVQALDDGRHALIAHDKASPLFVLDLATGALVGAPLSSPRFPTTAGSGPKWEGMARDSAGRFYVVGSHSGKTDEERAARSLLVRFRLKESAAPSIDDASIVRWEIARSLAAALKAAGCDEQAVAHRKIEGLAVRERNGKLELVVGLREPGDKVRAFVADVTDQPDGSALELKPLFAFEAEPREGVESQLTALEYVPELGGFLVATAAEDADNAFHGNTLWFVADGRSSTPQVQKIATFEVAMKAEGLAVLEAGTQGDRTTVRLLVTYDNDPHATRIPSRFQTMTLIRTPR